MRGKIVSYKERIEAKRHEWEALIVCLVRPKTCYQLLGLTTGGQSGKCTVFPPTYALGDCEHEKVLWRGLHLL